MRETKFRAWDKRLNMMIEVDGLAINLSGRLISGYIEDGVWCYRAMPNIPTCQSEDDYILMQYTGLHDKNGKEIWEGDIFPHNGMNLVVKYELGAVVGHWFGSNEYIFFDHYANDDEVEVIGNVYENKELLNDWPRNSCINECSI